MRSLLRSELARQLTVDGDAGRRPHGPVDGVVTGVTGVDELLKHSIGLNDVMGGVYKVVVINVVVAFVSAAVCCRCCWVVAGCWLVVAGCCLLFTPGREKSLLTDERKSSKCSAVR